MPLLEEVEEGAEESSPGDAETLKANHRRKRASKARKKKRDDVRIIIIIMHGLCRKTVPYTPVECSLRAVGSWCLNIFAREGWGSCGHDR